MSQLQDEARLITRAQAGDREAFVTLCEANRMRLWRAVASVAQGADREDLAQEAIVRAYSRFRTYRAEASFGAWLCRIALNVAHDYQKSAWRRRRVPFPDDWNSIEPTELSPEQLLEQREQQRRIRQAITQLPERQRIPIWLHFFEEFALAEIARLERTSESTIRSRVQAGLKRLARLLNDLDQSPECPRPASASTKGYGL